MVTIPPGLWSATTARGAGSKSPCEFLRTKSAGATVLLVATVARARVGECGRLFHEELWDAVLAIDLDGNRIALTLSEWVNVGCVPATSRHPVGAQSAPPAREPAASQRRPALPAVGRPRGQAAPGLALDQT
jgi:hypothetical protein